MYAERKWGGNDFGSDFGAPGTMEVASERSLVSRLVRFGDRAAWLGFLRWALPRSLSQEADDGAEFTTPAAVSVP